MNSNETKRIALTVNGQRVTAEVPARYLLADFVRHQLRLTGTHVGCAHGACGACTVLLDGRPVRSCTIFAVQVDGSELQTVEGLCREDGMSALQEQFQANHALQCGYCTPGMLVSATALLNEIPDPSEEQIRQYMAGNLCRCTGYQPIVLAIRAAADIINRQSDASKRLS